MRRDLVLQTAVDQVDDLTLGPTLSRLDTTATDEQATALHGVLLDQFIASRGNAADQLILDIDATHIPLHGQQERAHFNRHYDKYWAAVRVLRPGHAGLRSAESALAQVLGMHVVVQAAAGTLPAIAGLLHTAEWRRL